MPKLVNLGSLCIDSVYSVPNIAQAGETVASSGRQLFPGGKGLNQSIAAAHAGASVAHFGAVGEDGDLLLDALVGAGVAVDGVERVGEPSGHAVIQVDPLGRNSIVISGGANRVIHQAIIDGALTCMGANDWLLLQNEVNDVDGIIRQADGMRSARAASQKIALNLAPADERIGDYPLELLDLLIVNEIEARAAAGEEDLDAAFAGLVAKLRDTSIVLTQGAGGLRYHDCVRRADGRLGSFAVTAVDETAAGDAFVGYLLAGLVAGRQLPEVLLEASAAGALAVTCKGAATAIPTRDAVLELMRTQPLQ